MLLHVDVPDPVVTDSLFDCEYTKKFYNGSLLEAR